MCWWNKKSASFDPWPWWRIRTRKFFQLFCHCRNWNSKIRSHQAIFDGHYFSKWESEARLEQIDTNQIRFCESDIGYEEMQSGKCESSRLFCSFGSVLILAIFIFHQSFLIYILFCTDHAIIIFFNKTNFSNNRGAIRSTTSTKKVQEIIYLEDDDDDQAPIKKNKFRQIMMKYPDNELYSWWSIVKWQHHHVRSFKHIINK